jgi:hypothetical protein
MLAAIMFNVCSLVIYRPLSGIGISYGIFPLFMASPLDNSGIFLPNSGIRFT